jgi:hypothetical protein
MEITFEISSAFLFLFPINHEHLRTNSTPLNSIIVEKIELKHRINRRIFEDFCLKRRYKLKIILSN